MGKPAAITISLEQARKLRDVDKVQLQGAGLHQVMGPHYKEIIYIQQAKGKSPFISKSHTVKQIMQLLQTTPRVKANTVLARLLPLIADDIPITLTIADKVKKLGFHTKLIEMAELYSPEEMADPKKQKSEIVEATLGFIKAAIIVWQNKRIYAEIGVGNKHENYRLASRKADLTTILKILRDVQPLHDTYDAAKNKLKNLQDIVKWTARATPVSLANILQPIKYDGKIVGYLPQKQLDEFVKLAKQIRARQVIATEHDGDKYFKLTDVDNVKNHKSRETLVYMSPADFLLMAERADLVKDKAARVDKLLKQHVVFDSTPFLGFIHDGKGMAQVVGHEGRHRVSALKAIGIKQIPVILRSQEGGKGKAIRWGSQQANSIDKVPVLPSKMRGEDKRGTIDMPHSIIYPTTAKAIAAIINLPKKHDPAKCGGPGCCATCGAEWQSKYGVAYPEKSVIVARAKLPSRLTATATELTANLAAIYAEYNTGVPLHSLAKNHHAKLELLKQLLVAAYGTTWREARLQNSVRAARVVPMLADLYQEYNAGKSLTRIASEHDVSDVLLAKLFIKAYGKAWHQARQPRPHYQPEHLRSKKIKAHSDTHSKRVADTIMQQMGGSGKLAAMLGAKNFVRLQSGLQFDISSRSTKNKANKVAIIYEPGSDEYTMIFYRLRNLDLAKLSVHPHLTVAQLKPTFTQATGLDLHL